MERSGRAVLSNLTHTSVKTRIAAICTTAITCGWASAAPTPFPDVPADHWAARAVADLSEWRIVVGGRDGLFRGDQKLIDHELLLMLGRTVLLLEREKLPKEPVIDPGSIITPEQMVPELTKRGYLDPRHALANTSGRTVSPEECGRWLAEFLARLSARIAAQRPPLPEEGNIPRR